MYVMLQAAAASSHVMPSVRVLLPQVPYCYRLLNHIWIGLFCTLLYTSTLLLIIFYSPDKDNAAYVSSMTWVRVP
jgi:hypothetical protein